MCASGDRGVLGDVRPGTAQPLRGDAQAPDRTHHSGDGHRAGAEPQLFRYGAWADAPEARSASPTPLPTLGAPPKYSGTWASEPVSVLLLSQVLSFTCNFARPSSTGC